MTKLSEKKAMGAPSPVICTTRARQAASTALSLLVLCGTASSQSQLSYKNYAPTWSPDGSKVAFYSTRDGDWEIYTVNSDGSDLLRITNSPGYDGEPSWSPDGGKIAFTSDRDGDDEIFIMNKDGSGVAQLTHNQLSDDNPVWSPIDEKILFRRQTDESQYLFLMASNGSKTKRLSSVVPKGRARWSSNGQEIAFVVDHADRQAIFRMSRDGDRLGLVLTRQGFPGNPHYSPDGSILLYDAHMDGIADSGDGKWEIWSVTVDGAVTTRLTRNVTDDWGAQWSPDGRQIVFAGGGLRNSGYDIYIVDSVGHGLRMLTRRPHE